MASMEVLGKRFFLLLLNIISGVSFRLQPVFGDERGQSVIRANYCAFHELNLLVFEDLEYRYFDQIVQLINALQNINVALA